MRLYIRMVIWAQVAWVLVLATFCYGAMNKGGIGELGRTLEEIARRAQTWENAASKASRQALRKRTREKWARVPWGVLGFATVRFSWAGKGAGSTPLPPMGRKGPRRPDGAHPKGPIPRPPSSAR